MVEDLRYTSPRKRGRWSVTAVDAQAALIEEMENLLDVAETLVVEKELRVTRSLLELPV
ncbi:hypothetical protein QJS10_CPA09g01580 [Acorus calamus]|uniref:Uncharacterized protein n=1 Tax=Acorus calamus TaxID=4465 RepID=A0AAV9E8R7_ACOCL|nr:hypothetical protein QJS10_CPA09g01580 [Acorus calamus]